MTDKHHTAEETAGDTQTIIDHAKENPFLYIAGVAVVVCIAIAAVLFRLNSDLKAKEQASAYAAAIDMEDPMERMIALGEITEGSSKYMAEALLLQGLAARDSEDYDTAKKAFTTLREDYPEFRFTPQGVEGLGEIQELQGNYVEAIAIYKEVQTTWPDSFAARRQPFNIGRAHAANDNPEEALKAYQEQLQVFPGSNVAIHAQQKLDELESLHPTLAQAVPEEASVLTTTDSPTN